jgi:pyruvate ferredoxin oxidoreductase alpha subunit
MAKKVALTGNEAVALAMKQIDPDVVAAYPITPQTEIVQTFSSFVAEGLVKTEYITVESEHSAMSATVGASAAGVRAMTATSANGLALMWEVLYIAASNRLPIVMPVVNRALSGPINIHCDHSDSMGARDAGWIHLFSETAQEAYDNMIQAVRIAEHKDVLLPVMVMMDGFIISHSLDTLETLNDASVKKFIGEFDPTTVLLDTDNPITVGPLDLYDYYFEHKRQQAEGMINAKEVIAAIAKEYEALTGRKYDYFETYRLEDAEIALVVLGSTAGTSKDAVDVMREKGIKAGMLKLRVFRPFPYEEILEALKHLKAVAIMDRSDSFNAFGGPVFNEVRSAMYESVNRPPIYSYIYGLGGRDVDVADICSVIADMEKAAAGKPGKLLNYLGVRE